MGTKKTQSPMSRELGDGAFYILYVGPSCFTPPRSQRGLRAKKLKSMVLKGAEEVKEFKGIM